MCWFGGRQGVSQVLVWTNGIGDLIDVGDVYWIVADVQKAGGALFNRFNTPVEEPAGAGRPQAAQRAAAAGGAAGRPAR